jgi:tRNA pseudouridine38-40 synthase
MSARTIRLVLEYDGTDLCGWQRQLNGPTVQQHVEEALELMLGAPAQVTGASRTDSGVHALGQVAAFRTESSIPAFGFRRGLNGHLPPSIAVIEADEVPESFHPRFDARGKHYRYALLMRQERSPIDRDRAWHVPVPVDIGAMREAAAHLIGEHDFAAFRATGCGAKTTQREITEVTISDIAPDRLHIDVRGNAFLRNMVRIVAGTLVDVGHSRLAPSQMAEIITARDRTRAGQTAPAHGLTLVQVFY